MGILLTIEGGDGSGKATQTKLLQERLEAEGYKVKAVSFPNYDSPASEPIKMYLKGNFGSHPEDVNPFVASMFYAIDRFASYRMEWEKAYKDGYIILADRYTTSNMVHQMIKYEVPQEKKRFLQWLEETEFERFGLPRPDGVILLDMPLELSLELMRERTHKTGGETGDIHEKDAMHLKKVHDVYDELVHAYGWMRINCATADMQLRSIEDIHEEVYRLAQEVLRKEVN